MTSQITTRLEFDSFRARSKSPGLERRRSVDTETLPNNDSLHVIMFPLTKDRGLPDCERPGVRTVSCLIQRQALSDCVLTSPEYHSGHRRS